MRVVTVPTDPFGVFPPSRRLIFTATELATLRRASEIAARARELCRREVGADFELWTADHQLAGIEHGLDSEHDLAAGLTLRAPWAWASLT